jgi:dTDP-4-dehydrorhamnose reductase
MTRKVLLLGSGGQLGMELACRFSDLDLIALDRRGADLSHPESLRSVIREARPGLILNAAAYTAVDRAESEPELADTINHRAVRVIAEEAQRIGALLVHYSTDYVFDGSKQAPWAEDDGTAPLNIYGASKLAGEQAIAAACENYLVLRTSWVYAGHGQNFLRTMLRLGAERPVLRVVNDQLGAPTSAAALAEATRQIVERAQEGSDTFADVYHATCGGKTTWDGFARTIFDIQADLAPAMHRPQVEGIPASEYPTPAQRPQNSVLDNGKLRERFGIQLPTWENALREVMARVLAAAQTGTIQE